MTRDTLLAELQRLQAAAGESQLLAHELAVHRQESRLQKAQLLAAQRELEHSHAVYADLYEFAPLAYLTLTRQGLIQAINLTGVQLLGGERVHLLGRPLLTYVVHEDRPRFLEHLRRCRTGAAEVVSELRLRSRAGAEAAVQLSSRPPARSEEPVFHTAIADLSAVKRAEQEIRQLNATLEQRVHERTLELEESNVRLAAATAEANAANQAKSEFLANMSHEIRTPLQAILGFAELLELQPDEGLTEGLETIRRNGLHLLEIINDVLDLSKIEHGRLEVLPVRCSPAELIADLEESMHVKIQQKRLAFEVAFRGPLPGTIRTDPSRLRQVLTNLLGNAVKFTEEGGVRLVVGLENAPEPLLVFEVIDSGIGIPPADRERIFEQFFQGDRSVSRRFGGTGLGLTISRQLARLLGGDITIENNPAGQGSLVRLTIATGPLEGVPLVEPAAHDVLAAGRQPALRKLTRPTHVLLAEDGRDNQLLVTHFLRLAGASVEVAPDGRKVLEAVSRADREGRRFDLILMDMHMPVVDGFSATHQLRTSGCRTPIIAVTARAMKGDRERCLQAGCNDYLAKPIDQRRLVEIVARHTTGSHSQAG